MKHYDKLNDEEKFSILNELYHSKNLSWARVADILEITVDKARKQGKKLGIKSRDKSKAQKVALEEGRSEHRTAGRKRSEEEKKKISEGVGKVWDGLTEDELEERRQWARDAWEEKSEAEKAEIAKRSSQALNVSSRHGSKLERYLLIELNKRGYMVDFHKIHMLRNRNLTIDLLIRELSTAIEVDGPAHFEPIRGEQALQKTIASDQQKTGLILSEGLCLIRIKQTQTLSDRYMRKVLANLLSTLESIEESFPPQDYRYFEI
jgi:very-short-patch-repair endonuclease